MNGEGSASPPLGDTISQHERTLGDTQYQAMNSQTRVDGEQVETSRSLFNEQILVITSQSVKELLLEYKSALATNPGLVQELSDRITKLAYLNMSYGFTKTSKMMAYVIIEHEKKISKLQAMCLKLEKVAEFYKSRNSELLEETRKKIEEFQSAFRNQENEILRLRTPTENYEYTIDRINKRCEILERSIDALAERPPNLNIAHLLPAHHHAYDFRRGFSHNESSARGRSFDQKPTTYLLHGRYTKVGTSAARFESAKNSDPVPGPGYPAYSFTDRDSSWRIKPQQVGGNQGPYMQFGAQPIGGSPKLSNLNNLSGPEWLEDYLREKKSPLVSDGRNEPKPTTGEFKMPSSMVEARIQQAQRSADRELTTGLAGGFGD